MPAGTRGAGIGSYDRHVEIEAFVHEYGGKRTEAIRQVLLFGEHGSGVIDHPQDIYFVIGSASLEGALPRRKNGKGSGLGAAADER